MIKRLIKWLRADFDRRTLLFAGISVFIYLAFAFYNGVLGIIFKSLWNGSICIYYLLLLLVKSILVIGEHRHKIVNDVNKRRVYVSISYIILIVITISMVTPVIQLLLDKRSYSFGLIPAIAMAAFTTYSITMAVININKSKKSDNEIVKQVRIINMISALMSVTVLQNTLILANGGYDDDMKTLSTVTSFAIILAVIIIMIVSFYKSIKRKNDNNDEEGL